MRDRALEVEHLNHVGQRQRGEEIIYAVFIHVRKLITWIIEIDLLDKKEPGLYVRNRSRKY